MAAVIRAISLAALLAVGCASSPYQPYEGMLRHPRHPVAVPDLVAEGWQLVEVEEADLAFRKNGSGLIAVRARCSDGPRPLIWETRDLWLGIPRRGLVTRELRVHGLPALETRAESDGLRVRTLTVQSESCMVDFAHVAMPHAGVDAIFDAFIEATRLVELGSTSEASP